MSKKDCLLTLYTTTYKPLRLAGRTIAADKQHRNVLHHFGVFLGRMPRLGDLDNEVAAKFLGWLADSREAITCNRMLDRLTAQWRFHARRGLIRTWPDVRRLPESEPTPLGWLEADMAKLWSACRRQSGLIGGVPAGLWWVALHDVIIDSAERIGAVMQLRWANVDLRNGWVCFPAATRKGRRRDRLHKLHADTSKALKAIQDPKRLLVFPWRGLGTSVWQQYSIILASAGLPYDRRSKFHRLRRTTASLYKRAGGDPMDLLDHTSRRTTRLYLDERIVETPQAADLVPRPPIDPAA